MVTSCSKNKEKTIIGNWTGKVYYNDYKLSVTDRKMECIWEVTKDFWSPVSGLYTVDETKTQIYNIVSISDDALVVKKEGNYRTIVIDYFLNGDSLYFKDRIEGFSQLENFKQITILTIKTKY
jgi:hypothetical protein